MTYQQTIEHLYEHLPMFSRIGAVAYKEDLHNTIALCNAIGNPQNKFRSIHIAGTNGKGSTSHMLAAILQQAGYKTGLYTSPHLKDFRERIKIDGEMVSEAFVVDFVKDTLAIADAVQPSFFELTVAMAFEYFANEAVDIAVIETGLGGRLDSTNIITPLLSVITNIGYDHMNILGDTLEKISFEKAGIIKPNVPVVVGEYLEVTKPVFLQKAVESNAPVYFSEDEFTILDIQSTTGQLICSIKNNNTDLAKTYTLDLPGLYQAKNLRTVLCALTLLQEKGFNIQPADQKEALSNIKNLTGLHGRWEVVGEHPLIVLDVAHNEDGMKQILKQVDLHKTTVSNTAQIHFVVGMVKDKEVAKVLSMLPADANYYFTNANIPRALLATELQEKAAAYNLTGAIYNNVMEAIDAAKKASDDDDLVIVCGSVFLVGEVDVDLL
ncbi:MAG: folylpolyglutamate synthase/dihydrofolate synthase family protein [Ferruginibacter sp.]